MGYEEARRPHFCLARASERHRFSPPDKTLLLPSAESPAPTFYLPVKDLSIRTNPTTPLLATKPKDPHCVSLFVCDCPCSVLSDFDFHFVLSSIVGFYVNLI